MASRALPSGTVTFLFTDVESSTRLLRELGTERYAEALHEHRLVIRDACAEHGGVEVDTQGDAFFFAFPTASGAIDAAEDLVAALSADGPIRVRVGLHTGTPLLTDEGYVGHDVHRAARIAAAGHANQILVSASTAALTEQERDLHDLGRHRFKDLAAPERIYQLGDNEFPPVRSLTRTNLPIPATPFLGRERELGEVSSLLRDDGVRLLTLTGPGGTGKTRLALQGAAEVADDYPDGVWWIPLADLTEPALVLEGAARAVGSTSDLAGDLSDKRLLLVFDNFEQVVDAATEVGALLAVCPNLDVITTSREPLRISSEQVYPVLPLDHDDGVAYFLARARAANPAFETDGHVPEICRRLDELPLALELAAARTRTLTPQAILDRLGERLPLLTGGARDAPERQRTLRATIEWSYGLLSPEEQRVFRGLSVFAGGCTLASAETVADADLDSIESLVDKSLLRHSDGRYWMLATIREYATELLREAGESDEIERRHAEHVYALAVSWNLGADPPGEQRFDLAIAEVDNVRAALAWALGRSEIDAGLQLAVALDYFWFANQPQEGVRWFSSLLEKGANAPADLRMRALRAYGSAAASVGQYDRAASLRRDALVLARELDERGAIATLLLELVNGLYEIAGYDAAPEADPLLDEALEAHAASNVPENEVFSLDILARLARYRDVDVDRARDLLERSVRIAGEAHLTWWEAEETSELASAERLAGRLDLAELHIRDALERQRRIQYRSGMLGALASLARLARDRGDPERAGWLWGAIEAEEARRPASWAMDRAGWQTLIVAGGEPEFERARREGSLLDLDEAIVRALAEAGPGQSSEG